jgi:post-segregation antitoxin (ccd killing protein)
MSKISNIQSIRFSDIQVKSLQKLKEYDVNISQFIRSAVAEKIKRDWPGIKERKEKVRMPF